MLFNVTDGTTSDQGNFEMFKQARIADIVGC